MDTTTKIKMAMAAVGISEAELARRLNTTPQAFHQRMKTSKWSDGDLDKIATALGCEIVVEFRFPDGTVIASSVCRVGKDLLCPMFQAPPSMGTGSRSQVLESGLAPGGGLLSRYHPHPTHSAVCHSEPTSLFSQGEAS